MAVITGAGGFIGRALCATLVARGWQVRRVHRRPPAAADGSDFVLGDLGPGTDWHTVIAGAHCVFHLAARTHVLQEAASDPLATYRAINVPATERLAREAAAAGVRRLVFASSIKVNGEVTTGTPFREDDPPRPEDAYGATKLEAEQRLQAIAAETGLTLTVVRPPLVYGPGVKGNFLRLMDLVARGVPLPLASIDNRRSLVHLDNLVDALIACATAPAAAGRTYLVSDGEEVSTPELVRRIARALGVPARLFPFPSRLLRLGAALLGRGAEARRLTASLQIDPSRIGRELNWRPPVNLAAGIAGTARWYRDSVMRLDTPI